MASRADGRAVGGRILQLLEIVLVGTVPYVQLGLETFPTFRTVLPLTLMPFHRMVAAQRISPMVSRTGVPRVREHDVLVLVITDPPTAALRPNEGIGPSAKAACLRRPDIVGRWRTPACALLSCHSRRSRRRLTDRA